MNTNSKLFHFFVVFFSLWSSLGWVNNASAQEMGKVISSTPIVQHISVPFQSCSEQQVMVQRASTGLGAGMGAIAGGALGKAVFKDPYLGIAVGALGGAVLGNRIEGTPPPEFRQVQSCSTQYRSESRIDSYSVLYEFAGKQYRAVVKDPPGTHIYLQVAPVGAIGL
jgi:uncharacterized protein YcfJ